MTKSKNKTLPFMNRDPLLKSEVSQMKRTKKATNLTSISRKHLLNDEIISIILTTSNDEEIVRNVMRNINQLLIQIKVNYEIIIIDNNSSDKTVERIQASNQHYSHLRTLVLSKVYSKEIALTAGLDSCIGDFVVIFDPYTDPANLIKMILEKLYIGNDIVIAKFKRQLFKQSYLTSLVLLLVEKISTHEFYYPPNYTLGLSRKAVNSITRTRRKNRSFSYLSSLIGLKKTYVEYNPLTEYTHKIKIFTFINFVIDIADTIISNSFKPIRIIAFTGMFASIAFVVYVFIIVVLITIFKMSWIAPQGWISLASVMGTLFFLLFSLLTIISEYIVRIMDESRNEPLYFISDEYDASNLSKRKILNVINK